MVKARGKQHTISKVKLNALQKKVIEQNRDKSATEIGQLLNLDDKLVYEYMQELAKSPLKQKFARKDGATIMTQAASEHGQKTPNIS